MIEMPFPESPRTIYDKNPLDEVICQLRFPAILTIAATDPANFQDRVRVAGYPLYETEKRVAELPGPLADMATKFSIELQPETPAHRFSSEDGTRIIVLAKDFLAVMDQQYTQWSNFHQELQLARRALEEEYHPAFYARTGLRYRNVISPSSLDLPEGSWADLIDRDVAGVLVDTNIGADVMGMQSTLQMAMNEVEGGQLQVRYGLRPSPDGPPSFIIDADFFVEERRGQDDVEGILDEFHRQAGRLFRWAITDRLHEALGPREA